MQRLACCVILAAAPLSALRRATQREVDFAAEALARADANSDGKGSYAELSSVASQLGDVDQGAAISFLEQTFRDADADADGLLNVGEVANLVSAFRDQLAGGSTDGQDADLAGDMASVAQEVQDELAQGRAPEEILKDVAKSLDANPEEMLDNAANVLGLKPEELEDKLEKEVEVLGEATD
eukprot:TRINITY_DN10324_c0_g1_i3.p1 TRINITY_DN10324_c0_g1~~TRINITY_DN10324_c0_g1_i3.p1  ORF type:complete len:206 (+),score=58.91 TRINITY_DN10324_c0_g1_i3:75-620(+)